MSNKYVPEKLEINYSNQSEGSKSIKLINNNFLVNNPNPELISVNQISEDKWIEFWQTLEKIGLWDLEELYEGCTLEGGFTWKIEISYETKEINSYGVNIEPKIVMGDKVYSVLEELYKSIEELISLDYKKIKNQKKIRKIERRKKEQNNIICSLLTNYE